MSSSIADLALLGRLFEEHRPRLLAMVQRRMGFALAGRIGAEDIRAETSGYPTFSRANDEENFIGLIIGRSGRHSHDLSLREIQRV